MSDNSSKDPLRVAAGLKATAHNPNMNQDTRDSALGRLQDMGVNPDEPLSSRNANKTSQEVSTDNQTYDDDATSGSGGSDAHDNHVMGGYKATLKNPNVSDKAKEHAQQVIDENQ